MLSFDAVPGAAQQLGVDDHLALGVAGGGWVVPGAAQQLGVDDRLRWIDALWNSVPADAEMALHPDWEAELGRRVAAMEEGIIATVPWTKNREEALTRVNYCGQNRN